MKNAHPEVEETKTPVDRNVHINREAKIKELGDLLVELRKAIDNNDKKSIDGTIAALETVQRQLRNATS